MLARGDLRCCRDASKHVCFRYGPLFVKSSKRSLAAGFVLPYVVDKVAAT